MENPEKTKESWDDEMVPLEILVFGVWKCGSYITIAGRLKDVIKSGEEWTSSIRFHK